MIHIAKNEEEFYNLPAVDNNQFSQHTPQNMAYKAMLFSADKFWAGDLGEILYKRYGIELRPTDVAKGLSMLYNKNYVTRKKIQNTYSYTKTYKYHDATREWMKKMGGYVTCPNEACKRSVRVGFDEKVTWCDKCGCVFDIEEVKDD
ncbi:MAG: hypothetical protein GWN17_04625 [Candidatus Korarchaeota archaeon]|nr:hypothetical protein [Candidatus Korarchaeota archaeon]